MARHLRSNQSVDKWFHIIINVLLLLLHTFCSTNISLAIAADYEVIEFLPGFKGPLPFYLETGYIGVGELEEVQLFYYFVKSERKPKEDPLLLWICGGPGCSGYSALVYETGPLEYNYNMEEHNNGTLLPTLVLNPYSWTKTSSIIFIDSPVGTGFSYAKTPMASRTTDLKQVDNLNQFLRKWFINHPEFKDNPFYLSGGSYSGIPIPALALQISKENDEGVAPTINLKGYTLGNPVADPHLEENFGVKFANRMALISDELYKSLKRNCGGEYVKIDPSNTKCLKDMQAYEKCVSGIHFLHISQPWCSIESQNPEELVSGTRPTSKNTEPRCIEDEHVFSLYWANDPSVRRALGIREGTINKWERCNFNLPYHKDIESSVEHHFNLSTKGHRSLIFNGDHDMLVSFIATQAWIRSLNFSIVDDWRPWIVHDQIAGYSRTYSNRMTYATVKGAGHTPCQYKPKECFFMFQRWIDGQSL